MHIYVMAISRPLPRRWHPDYIDPFKKRRNAVGNWEARRMVSKFRLFGLACATLAAGALGIAPASAQKKGGTLTVGLELDIPGFDPLKVGVYDTAANIAASLLLETLVKLDDNGKPRPKLALSWSSSEDF